MRDVEEPLRHGPISWMARHPVAANLLMVAFLIGGLVFALQMKQEVFPSLELDYVTVTVAYPGASPEEVEQGITLAIEDEARSLSDVKRVVSSSAEGIASIFVELQSGADADAAVQDMKNAVDTIQSFPEEAERPIVNLLEPKREVISVIIYGPHEEQTLRELAERVRDELLLEEDITVVDISGARPYEIAVEVPQSKLRAHNLTLGEIAGIIRQTAIELPGGAVKAAGGEVLLRTQERRDYASEFARIPLVSRADGGKVYLDDIAELYDTFEDTDQEAYFNGQPAMRIDVFRVGAQYPLDIAEKVRTYVDDLRRELPEDLNIAILSDRSEIFRDRIELLVKNGLLGLFLVLMLLGLFLEPRLAFWVMMGIPISIVGSFLFVSGTDASINMVSLFAFIVTLGIVVDDAVVVGEIIYQKREQGMDPLRAAILGAREIAGPVVFAVLTNICAFVPLLFMPGATGKIFFQIPAITISVFAVSLVESLYVLPAHLSHPQGNGTLWRVLSMPTDWFNRKLKRFIQKAYKPVLSLAVLNPYVTLSAGVSMLILCGGAVGAGYVQFSFLPRIEADRVTARAEMTFGVPIAEARALQKRLNEAAQEVLAESGEDPNIAMGFYTQIGKGLGASGPATPQLQVAGAHLVGVQVILVPAGQRALSAVDFAQRWRDKVGQLPAVESLSFSGETATAAGKPIDVTLSHRNRETLEQAATDLGRALGGYAGVSDIDSGVSRGKEQMTFTLTPQARSLGITSQNLAQQVRHAFYGAEALRQQRGRHEIKVLVRLPEEERSTIYTLEELVVRSPQGGEIPLEEAAKVSRGKAYTVIERSQGRRKLSVVADVDDEVANAAEIVADLQKDTLPELVKRYPGLSFSFEGEQRERQESIDAMSIGFPLAMLGIYVLLAIPFGSYLQPLIVMLSIPFGIVGAILGHVLLGYNLSIISFFGIIALAGVVVNDSLVMVVTANRNRTDKGMSAIYALRHAGMKRFRPIILTSLTTFFGLAPMIFETSRSARFLIPMAVSLGFGVLFATFIILLIVPAAYIIVDHMTAPKHPD